MGFIRGPQRCEEGYRKRQRQHLVTSCVGSFGPTATEFRFTLANLILLHLDVNLPALVRRVGSGARSLGGADQRPAPRSPSHDHPPDIFCPSLTRGLGWHARELRAGAARVVSGNSRNRHGYPGLTQDKARTGSGDPRQGIINDD